MRFILAILCFLLAALIFYQVQYYGNHNILADTELTAMVENESLPDKNNSLKSISAYSEIIKRPLFSADRRPPAVLPESVLHSVDIDALRDLTLWGVAISGQNRYAIVDGVDDDVKHMKVGYVYKGWNVSEINTDSVKFESAKGQYELFILPNDTDKKSGIKKSYGENNDSTRSVNPSEFRPSLFRSSRKPVESPIDVTSRPVNDEPEERLTQEELDSISELGEEGGYRYDPEEDFESEEDFDE